MPFRPFPLSSECPFHDISPCRVSLAVSLSVSVLRYLSPCSWFVCMSLWPIFLVACHLTPSSLRGGCAVVLMLPWFDGSLVWAMYSVVDPTYKAIAVAGYLCISVRWIIYHIDTLGSCHFFLGGSLQISSFSFLMADLRLLHASVMQLFHDQLSCSCLWGHLHCTWVPNMASLPGPNSSHLISSCIS